MTCIAYYFSTMISVIVVVILFCGIGFGECSARLRTPSNEPSLGVLHVLYTALFVFIWLDFGVLVSLHTHKKCI